MILAPDLAALGPNVIGATGGSGTRVFARIARLAGLYIGTNITVAEDQPEFGVYSDRWINPFTPYRKGSLPESLETPMLAELERLLVEHCRGLDSTLRVWGWKEPRSIFLLPFFHRHMPSLRFLHVVRDGRDMAFSSNQNQLSKHGAVIGLPERALSVPAQSISLWSWLNLETARYGKEQLGPRYLRLRFEDLCVDPVATAAKMLDFFELEGDPLLAEQEVVPPESPGRWRTQDMRTVGQLSRIAGDALAAFGYDT